MTKFRIREAVVMGFTSSCDVEMEMLLTYALFAEQWGWTPKDVNELDADMVMKLRYLLLELLKEKERVSKREMRKVMG